MPPPLSLLVSAKPIREDFLEEAITTLVLRVHRHGSGYGEKRTFSTGWE
jgi:hypothetical protein